MDDAHAVDHFSHSILQGVSTVLRMHLEVLLDLYEPIPQCMEEVRLEVI